MGLFSLLKEKAPAGNSIALEEPSAPTGRAKSAFFPNTGVPGRHARFAEFRDDHSDEYATGHAARFHVKYQARHRAA